MATLKQRLHRKNADGSYDVIHLETSASVVMRADGATSVEDSLATIESWDLLKYEEAGDYVGMPYLEDDASTLQGHPASYFATAEEAAVLKTSVSEGKALVAAAVTDKGVTTAADATFNTIANNIASIATLDIGTADATADAADILAGDTAYVKGSKVTGTMINNGAVSKAITPSTSSQSYTIPAGYHNGSGKVTVAAAPTSLIDGDAVEADVLLGKKFFSDSYTVKTGSMANNGAVSPSALAAGGSYTIPAGYHNGSGKVTTKTLASQTSATATTADIISGKTAYVNGSKVTGSIDPGSIKSIPPQLSDWSVAEATLSVGYSNGNYSIAVSAPMSILTSNNFVLISDSFYFQAETTSGAIYKYIGLGGFTANRENGSNRLIVRAAHHGLVSLNTYEGIAASQTCTYTQNATHSLSNSNISIALNTGSMVASLIDTSVKVYYKNF